MHLKILVICGRYGLSGVPLAQQRLASLLSDRGHSVTFMPLYKNIEMQMTDEQRYRVKIPGIKNVVNAAPYLVGHFRAERYDLVFSAGDHLNAIVLLSCVLALSRSKIACSSRVTPFDTYISYRRPFSRSWFIYWLIRLLSWRCDLFSCVSSEMARQYESFFPGLKYVPVYNPVVVNTKWRDYKENWIDPFPPSRCRLLAVGSLERWKGFDTLIKSMAYLSDPRRFHLVIVGEGSERAALSAQIRDLQLEDSITLCGSKFDLKELYAFADIFILSSRVEGMPNVLLEALSYDCKVVSTNCPTGPEELLSGGAGTLVPVDDPSAMAAAILSTACAPLPQQRQEEALEPFSPQVVFGLYSVLLAEPFL